MQLKAEREINEDDKPAKVSKKDVSKHLAALTKESDEKDEVKAKAKEAKQKSYKMDKYKSDKTKYEVDQDEIDEGNKKEVEEQEEKKKAPK